MDYNNFKLRSLISFIIIIVYSIIALIQFEFIFFLIIILYALIILEEFIYFKKYKLLITIYLLSSLIFFLNIDFNTENLIRFNLMILIIISFDIFSYLFGKKFGSKKILKNISPKKTLEGLIAGVLSSYVFSTMYIIIFELSLTKYFLFTTIIIFSSFIGDIIESIFKRINNLKNSSNFLPGHGGFFDRFDSFILALIPYSLLSMII